MANLGWECPRCATCHAPFVLKCSECPIVLVPKPLDPRKNTDPMGTRKTQIMPKITGKPFDFSPWDAPIPSVGIWIGTALEKIVYEGEFGEVGTDE